MPRPYRISDEERKRRSERASKRMKAMHSDPDFARANSERMRKRQADPLFRAKQTERVSAFMREVWRKAKQA